MCNYCKHLLDLKSEGVSSVIENEIKNTQTKTIWPSPEVNLNTLDIIALPVSSPTLSPVPFKSRWHASFHLVFGRPLFLSPGISAPNTFLSMCSPSLLITCPYQFNLLSVIFLEACATFVVPRMCSFLILSLRVTPHIHRSILISVTSVSFSCIFVVAHVSAPYSITGLITVLYTFPFSFTGILLSHSTPLHFFQFLQPSHARFVISVSIPPSSSILVPMYLKWVTISSSSSSIVTGSRFPCWFCSNWNP